MAFDENIARRVPGRFWYAVALIIFIVSMFAPAAIVLYRVFGNAEAVVQIIAPETKTVRLASGTYTIFSESRAVVNGEIIISQGSVSGLRVAVQNARGEEIPVGPVRIASRYSHGGQTGFGVFEVRIQETGDYRVSATYRDQRPGQRAILSLRKDFLGNLLTSILLAVGVALAGALLSGLIFFRTLWKRRQLLLQTVTANLGGLRQGARTQNYTPPGTAIKPKNPAPSASPVEHQYDREK